MPVATLRNAVSANTTGPVVGLGTSTGTLTVVGDHGRDRVRAVGRGAGIGMTPRTGRRRLGGHSGDGRDVCGHGRAVPVLPGAPDR